MLVDSILLFFSTFSLLALVKFRQQKVFSLRWFSWLFLLGTFLALSICVKFVGFFTFALALCIIFYDFWITLPNKDIPSKLFYLQSLYLLLALIFWPLVIYFAVFYVHLSILVNAGPHDNIMTSAFQASLNGGLASIIKGQPLEIAHGSQITLKHTHGRACWLHSHLQVYPIRYQDGRGSSHQQQVTCYSFKDVNNWWIVKKPQKYVFFNKPI